MCVQFRTLMQREKILILTGLCLRYIVGMAIKLIDFLLQETTSVAILLSLDVQIFLSIPTCWDLFLIIRE